MNHIQKVNSTEFINNFHISSHGVVGLLNIDNKNIVYKISQRIDFINSHEYAIMCDISTLNIPHFCKPICFINQIIRNYNEVSDLDPNNYSSRSSSRSSCSSSSSTSSSVSKQSSSRSSESIKHNRIVEYNQNKNPTQKSKIHDQHTEFHKYFESLTIIDKVHDNDDEINEETEENLILKYWNPFLIPDINDKRWIVPTDIILMEYIDYPGFSESITDNLLSDDVLLTIIKQMVICIMIAQNERKFVHYDLHTDNILIKQCDYHIVNVYKINDECIYIIPTFGYIPVIIDYGFSYTEKVCKQTNIKFSLQFEDIGFNTYKYDQYADIKLLFITSAYDMRSLKTEKSKQFKKITKDIFGKIDLDEKNGWYKVDKNKKEDFSYMNTIIKYIGKYFDYSRIFYNNDYDCLEIIHYLVTYPLTKTILDEDVLINSFKMFIYEFLKIEETFRMPHHLLYILQEIVLFASKCRESFFSKDKNIVNNVLKDIKIYLFEKIRKIKLFYTIPKHCCFVKLLYGLYTFTDQMTACIYLTNKTTEKFLMEQQISLDTDDFVKNVYMKINKIPIKKYIYNDKSILQVYDIQKNTNFCLKLTSKDQTIINKNNTNQSEYINSLIKNYTNQSN